MNNQSPNPFHIEDQPEVPAGADPSLLLEHSQPHYSCVKDTSSSNQRLFYLGALRCEIPTQRDSAIRRDALQAVKAEWPSASEKPEPSVRAGRETCAEIQ